MAIPAFIAAVSIKPPAGFEHEARAIPNQHAPADAAQEEVLQQREEHHPANPDD